MIVNDNSFQYIIVEPEKKAKIGYIKLYSKNILKKKPNVVFTNEPYRNNVNDKTFTYK